MDKRIRCIAFFKKIIQEVKVKAEVVEYEKWSKMKQENAIMMFFINFMFKIFDSKLIKTNISALLNDY